MSAVGSFPLPGKLYFKQGCLPVALRELTDVYHASRVLILADEEMLHDGRLAPLTGILYDLGLDYAVNSESFAADAVIVYTAFADQKQWNAVPDNVPRILIPASVIAVASAKWNRTEMLILDEDFIPDAIPVSAVREQTLKTAYGGLTGSNASDYTLAWAVQAMRLIFGGNDSKSTLLHAFFMALLSMLAAHTDDAVSEGNLFPEAAEALGMTENELKERISSYS